MATIIRTNGRAEVIRGAGKNGLLTLEQLQEAVGGSIEAVYALNPGTVNEQMLRLCAQIRAKDYAEQHHTDYVKGRSIPRQLMSKQDVYIADAIPRDHGGSVVFQTEIANWVFCFELEPDGRLVNEPGRLYAGNVTAFNWCLEAAREHLQNFGVNHKCSLRAKRVALNAYEFVPLKDIA